MSKKARVAKMRQLLAESGSVALSTPDRVKYGEDQPRDDRGEWTSDGGAQDAASRVVGGMAKDPGMWGNQHRAEIAAGRLGSAMHDLRGAASPGERATAMRSIVGVLNDGPAKDTSRHELVLSHGPTIGNALADLHAASRGAGTR